MTHLFLLASNYSTFVPSLKEMLPFFQQLTNMFYLWLLSGSTTLFFPLTPSWALHVKGLLEMVLLLRCKKPYQLPVQDTFFCLLKTLIHGSFTCLQTLPFNLMCLWDFLRYVQRQLFFTSALFIPESQLPPHLRQWRWPHSPRCRSSRLPRVLAGHWWSHWLWGGLSQGGRSPSWSCGLWRLWALHFVTGFHKTLLLGWFASLFCCTSLSAPAPDQSHLATYPQWRDV